MSNKTIKELAVELTVEITELTDNLRNRRVFVNQILRSCSSIGANAHEASYANSKADFINKFHIALKECSETEYWIEVLVGSSAITEEKSKALLQECGIIRRMLVKSITTAKGTGEKYIIGRGINVA